jgi:16S rRNA processing protein RimM
LGGFVVEWVELGRLGAPYGIKGWLHIESHTDPKQGLLEYRDWTLKFSSGERAQHRLAEGRIHGEGLVARIEGVADRNAAARLTGARIEVQRERLPAPKKNEYYQADLVGMKVGNLAGAALGEVSHFVDSAAGPLMVIVGEGHEYWVPARPQHLKKVDLEARTIVVDWPAEAG